MITAGWRLRYQLVGLALKDEIRYRTKVALKNPDRVVDIHLDITSNSGNDMPLLDPPRFFLAGSIMASDISGMVRPREIPNLASDNLPRGWMTVTATTQLMSIPDELAREFKADPPKGIGRLSELFGNE